MSEATRKLASVQRIAEKKPIEGADNIEAVRLFTEMVVLRLILSIRQMKQPNYSGKLFESGHQISLRKRMNEKTTNFTNTIITYSCYC
jgi:hypothetical protein